MGDLTRPVRRPPTDTGDVPTLGRAGLVHDPHRHGAEVRVLVEAAQDPGQVIRALELGVVVEEDHDFGTDRGSGGGTDVAPCRDADVVGQHDEVVGGIRLGRRCAVDDEHEVRVDSALGADRRQCLRQLRPVALGQHYDGQPGRGGRR